MKNLLIFVLVLGMASMAVAAITGPYFQVDPASQKDNYVPSDLIKIDLVSPTSDPLVIGITIDAITDSPTGATMGNASEPQLFNANFGLALPGSLNDDGMLVEYMAASDTTIPARGATGILYSFEYHVPNVPYSTMINIQSFDDGGTNWSPAAVVYKSPGGEVDGTIGMLTPIHVIPEPATIALLGLGGLLLKRRK